MSARSQEAVDRAVRSYIKWRKKNPAPDFNWNHFGPRDVREKAFGMNVSGHLAINLARDAELLV